MAKGRFLFVCLLFSLSSVSCAAETAPPRETNGCLAGKLVTQDLKTGSETSGQLKVADACLNREPDSRTPGQTMPGSVNMVFCLPGMAPCGHNNTDQKVYLNVVLPKSEFASSLVEKTKEKDRLVSQEGGFDFYQNEESGSISRIPRNGDIYSVSCWGNNNEICDAIGLTEYDIQYFARAYGSSDSIDWQALHEGVRDFIRNTVEFK